MRKILQVFLILILCSNTIYAATWYVRTGGNGDGTTANTAFGTITAAMAAASNGDIIDIGPGSFAERLSITKSLELRGNNAGSAPWNWSQPATTILPPSTNFESTSTGSLAYIQANGVKIDGIEFTGVNENLSDAAPRVINNANSRAAWGITVATGFNNVRLQNNKLLHLTSRGIAAASTEMQNELIEVKDNVFHNITGVNNLGGIAILTTNHVPLISGNRVERSDLGILLQYSASPNISGVATITANQIEAHILGIAVRGFNGAIAPAHLIENNTIERINYDLWSADGLTKPASITFTGMDLSNLLGENNIRVEGNTISEARSAIYLLNIVRSQTNPDRLLLKNNTHLNSQAGIYIDNATVAATRAVVESSVIRNSTIVGLEVRGHGQYENELVLRNGVIIEHPAPLTDNYGDAIYLSGEKAVISELNDTRISSAKYNFITFHENAMAGKEVDGNNVTYDGLVRDFTFDNYKPSAEDNGALRAAVKERIMDADQESHAGSGRVIIAPATNTTWYVRAGATGNGTTEANAFGSITAAIDAAINGNVIDVGPGTFSERLSITKSLELRGSNAGSAPWNWSQAPTKIIPPSTIFETGLAGALVVLEANEVKIDGIEFDGVNNTLSDAAPRVINGANARSGWGILASGEPQSIRILNSRFQNFTSRGIALAAASMQTSALEVENNIFDNITSTGTGVAYAILTTNYLPKVTGNRISNSNSGIMLQYSATPNVTGEVNVTSNQIEAHIIGVAIRGFNNAIVPAHLVQDNTIERMDYDLWSADGLTKPAGVEFTGIDLSNLAGDNNLRITGNTIKEARSAIYIWNVAKSTSNPDRLLISNGLHLNNRFGLYMDNASVANTRAVVAGTIVRDAKIVGMQVMGEGAFENELVLRNGVVIEHPAASMEEYGNAIYLRGEKAVLAELNDTKLSSARDNFIVFDDNAMAGREVDGNNVTYDGIVRNFIFENYKPSENASVSLRMAVKERILDGEDENRSGSGLVRIATVTGLQSLEAAAAVEVYPVPSNTGYIQINLNGLKSKQVSVNLCNLKGQQVMEQMVPVENSGVRLRLATASLPQGVYLLRLSDGNAVSTRKVIIE